LQSLAADLNKLATIVAARMDIEPLLVCAPGKQRKRVTVRTLLCFRAIGEFGIAVAELSMRLDISPSAISL
jgi:hypothetical protein